MQNPAEPPDCFRVIRVTRPKIFHFLETNLEMATAVHEHVHVLVDVHVLVIGFLIWLRLGCAVKFVASFSPWHRASRLAHMSESGSTSTLECFNATRRAPSSS